MARPIPVTLPPTAAVQAYYTTLNDAVTAWFQRLAADLGQIFGIRLDDAGTGCPLAPSMPLLPAAFRYDAAADSFEELNAQLEQALARTRAAAQRLARHTQAQQVETALDAARQRWQALDGQLQQAAANMAQSVNRLSEHNLQRQVEAAVTDARLRVTLGPPPFGALQAQIDRSARVNAGLIKDIGEKAARDVEALVIDAVARGATDEIGPILQRRLNVTRTRAALIASNQTGRLESELSLLRGEASGANAFEWLHTASANPRKDHLGNVGKVFPLTYRPLPRQEPNCKCGMRFVWPSAETPAKLSYSTAPANASAALTSAAGGNKPPRPPRPVASGHADEYDDLVKRVNAFIGATDKKPVGKDEQKQRREMVRQFFKDFPRRDVPDFEQTLARLEDRFIKLNGSKVYPGDHKAATNDLKALQLNHFLDAHGWSVRGVNVPIPIPGRPLHEKSDLDTLATRGDTLLMFEAKGGRKVGVDKIISTTVQNYGAYLSNPDLKRFLPKDPALYTPKLAFYAPDTLRNLPPKQQKDLDDAVAQFFHSHRIIRDIDTLGSDTIEP